MTPEQLYKTRAERWRQNGNALVTLEDAEEWLQPLGLCLFLPRRVQLATPAPSFVEACLGQANAAPPLLAIENATALLTRLVDKGSVIPLNLLGISGEQPDFLVTAEALPYVFALRGDKDWKHEPQTAGNGRVSPLVLGIWKALERTGVQTAVELREAMGKELTEAAVLRGLSELWNAMRVIMLPGEPGEAATWELLKARYQKQMAAGSGMSQVSALSVLLAQYLESAVGATSEEAEIFLSPLSSRSKVRDVVRGLTATRQLAMIGLDGQAVLYVEGTLPEFEQPESQVTIEALGREATEAGTAEAAPTNGFGESGSGESGFGESGSGRSGSEKIKKFVKHTQRAPGKPDPLRWKRDSSVPPPRGQSRGPRPDSARPGSASSGSEGFDRRSKPAPTQPAAGRSRSRADGANERSAGRPGERPARPRFGAPRSDKPGRERALPSTRDSERASRPFSKPGFAARGERPSSRPSSSRPTPDRTFNKSTPGSASGGFDKKPRWVPRDGSAAADRPRQESSRPGRPPSGRPPSGRPGSDRPYSARPKTGFSSGSRPPAGGGSRSNNKPATSGFKPRMNRSGTGRPSPDRPRSDRSSSDRSPSNRPFSQRPSFSRPANSGGPASPGSIEKKPRWVPREGGATGRPPARRPGSSYSSGSRAPFTGGSRPSGKPGSGSFKPRTDRSFSPQPPSSRTASTRPAAPRSGGPGGFEKKPRWVAREGGGGSRPNTGGGSSSRPSGARPASSFGGKPSFGRKPGFGARPDGGGGPPPIGRGPSSGGSGRPSSGGRARPSGKPGFGRKPGGKPAFGKKRPGKGPGDFPKRKRPE